MGIRDQIRSMVPQFVLEWNRSAKKKKRNRLLEAQKQQGISLTFNELVDQFERAGVKKGTDLLVHSSLSRLGHVEGGAATVVEAILHVVGKEGNVLMPTSTVVTLQANHPTDVFNVRESPSKMGAISEYFRTRCAHARSYHPLEPVAVWGKDAEFYTRGHHTDESAYGPNSPWDKHMEHGGQILYLGTTLINSGTSLHAVEDTVGWRQFSFPIYLEGSKTFPVKTPNGRNLSVTTKVHNPKVSALRQCDALIPVLEANGVLKHIQIGQAPSLLVDSAGMKSVLLEQYYKHGITMYSPLGQ